MTVLALKEAEGLAGRTIAAINRKEMDADWDVVQWIAADRERVESDLDGRRQHSGDKAMFESEAQCAPCFWSPFNGRDCPDALRYSNNLRRTAALYGADLAA